MTRRELDEIRQRDAEHEGSAKADRAALLQLVDELIAQVVRQRPDGYWSTCERGWLFANRNDAVDALLKTIAIDNPAPKTHECP